MLLAWDAGVKPHRWKPDTMSLLLRLLPRLSCAFFQLPNLSTVTVDTGSSLYPAKEVPELMLHSDCTFPWVRRRISFPSLHL